MNWIPSMCCCGRYEKRFVTNSKGKPSKVCRNCGRNDPNEFYVKNFMMNKEPKYDTFSVSVDDKPEEHTGLSVDYYRVEVTNPTTAEHPYTAECNDIIEALGMNYAEGNVFKAIWRRCAERTLGKRKKANNSRYDAEKAFFFSGRILEQEDSE